MKVIGITGGIGSGKSYIAQRLQSEAGIPVYDCDSQAKRLNEQSPQIRQALTALVGPQVYDADGHLCKPVLATYLFASTANAARVNAAIHPHVKDHFRQWCSQHTEPLVGIESAILCESGFDTLVDTILFVDAPLELRIQRAMQRDGATRAQIEQRIARQDTTLARQLAQHIIMNDNSNNLNIKDYVRDHFSNLR